jgi:FKBP-type peptidyl-prolyl cis-trans isomerase 2
MEAAKKGDTVKVNFTGKLENGAEFDTTEDRKPLEFTLGDGSVIVGFEKGVTGMKPGEKKRFEVAPEEGYGEIRDDLIGEVPKTNFPKEMNPTEGKRLHMNQPDGTPMNFVVAAVNQNTITLDGNHPLAGKTLFFDVELLEIL